MKPYVGRAQVRDWLYALVAGMFALAEAPATAWADGELDTDFGTNGVVSISFPNSSHGYLYDLTVVNGAIEGAGLERANATCTNEFPNLFVVRVSLAGTIIGSPESYTQNAIRCPVALVVETATGDILVTGRGGSSIVPGGATAVRFSASGTAIATFVDVANHRYGFSYCSGREMLMDASGRMEAACGVRGEFGVTSMSVLRFSTQGDQLVLESRLSSNFDWIGTSPKYSLRTWNALARDDTSGAVYVGGYACSQGGGGACFTDPMAIKQQYVARLEATSLSLDTNYAHGGITASLSMPAGDVYSVTLDGSTNVLVGGQYGVPPSGYVARLTPTGTPDLTFGAGGIVQNFGEPIVDVRTDHNNRVYALAAGSQLFRLSANGTRDESFASGSDVVALNGLGSRWQAMQLVDSTRSSAYLFGGAGVSNSATTAIVAKVLLVTNAGPAPTTTVLTTSATTIASGQSVTFTATVTGKNPTGSVEFRDHSTSIGIAALERSDATLTTSALTVGTHSITAHYVGDTNNSASTSAPVTQTVNASSGHGFDSVGGGGSFALLETCMLVLLALTRDVTRPRHLASHPNRSWYRCVWLTAAFLPGAALGADIIGTSGPDVLEGTPEADSINGRGGADVMMGLAGDDTYTVNLADDQVLESVGDGTDTVRSAVSYTLPINVENLRLIGSAPINGKGNGLDNQLSGNSADNTLSGRAGDDRMIGHAGNDTYIVDSSGDLVGEVWDEGDDTIRSLVSYTVPLYVENLILRGTAAINGTGSELPDRIIGNAANNILSGLDGNDSLNGMDGDDRLVGGWGLNSLTGGNGHDEFEFIQPPNPFHYRDRIIDFSPIDDKILLKRSAFPALTTGTLPAAAFEIGRNATAPSVRILYDPTSGVIYYDEDGTGPEVATFFVTLTTAPTVTNANFMVVN